MYHPRFKGSHYEIGLKLGRILKKKKTDFGRIIDLNRFQKDFGKKSERLLLKVFPEICDEIRGLTDGLKYPYDEFASWLLCMACCFEPRDFKGCTGFCFTHNNNVYFGRNNDLPPFLKKESASMTYEPINGRSFIGNTSSMIHFEEGMNESGLAVAMEFIVPTVIVPGINSLFIVRYLLEKCDTTKVAVNSLKALPVSSACNIMLVDKNGDMAVAECAPKKIFIRKPGRDEDFIIAANHFISDEMSCYNACNIFSSDIRYQTAYNALKNKKYNNGVEHAKAILSGKHGFMCQYNKALNFETIWSSVFDITNNRIFRAEGDPSKTTFKEDKRFSRIILKKKK